ncbi:NAD(P)H-binding protein [Thalassotalea psychrophila]|uniref:NAD(P)H-binding protein n=1 Tax=Thalassotalea psychrophila TaxID=3065647 RepID=A0ABY9TQ34_9GAMM|nr:NAD(P)H-binding protein [Colwelliaceae bacterium SQ149]
MKSVLLFGSSGLTGQHCLQFLLESDQYNRVVIAVRRPILITHEKLSQVIVDFDVLDNESNLFAVDEVYCCLGTTIKKAGSRIAFSSIDLNLVITIAKLAKIHRVKKFLVVSALGANPKSSSFYNQTKGKMEAKLKTLNLNATYVFRPSLLLGDRNEFRLAEHITAILCNVFSFVFIGPLKTLKPIEAKVLAKAMVTIANNEQPSLPFQIIENQAIKDVVKLIPVRVIM